MNHNYHCPVYPTYTDKPGGMGGIGGTLKIGTPSLVSLQEGRRIDCPDQWPCYLDSRFCTQCPWNRGEGEPQER